MKSAACIVLVLASAIVPVAAGPSAEYSEVGSGRSEAVVDITLDQLTRMVLSHNPVVRSAHYGVDAARAGVRTASALGNPRVEIQQGQWQPSGMSRQSVRSWTFSQPIENPLGRRARVDAAEAGAKWSNLQLAITRNDLAAQVQSRAYEALLFQAEAESAADTLALLEQVRDRIRIRVETGEAPRYEMIKADAEVIHAREKQQSAQLQAQQGWLEIERLAAGQLPARWRLTTSFHQDVVVPDLIQLREQSDQFNPELISLKYALERAQAQLRFAQAGRWPGVELRYGETREPDVRQNVWGVVMQLPLLDQRSGPIAEARAEVARINTQLDGRRTELQQQIVLAWRSLEMARLKVEALGEGVIREAEAALRVAQAAYRYGERGILDMLDAQRVLRGVRSDLLQARYQLHVARIGLDHLAGRYAQVS